MAYPSRALPLMTAEEFLEKRHTFPQKVELVAGIVYPMYDGAQAMTGGYLNSGNFAVSWPTGEVGPMGLEGAVHLAYRRELAEIADPDARQARYQALVDGLYTQGKALNAAGFVEIDDVIDPADTRRWVSQGLRNAPTPTPRTGKKRPMVDAW